MHSPIYNVSEEEGDDSDTNAQLGRRRNAKQGGGLDGRDAARPTGSDGRPSNNGGRNISQAHRSVGGHGSDPIARSTQTNRRTKNSERPQSPKGGRGVGVAATEVPHTVRPRKNGVRWTAYLALLIMSLFFRGAYMDSVYTL